MKVKKLMAQLGDYLNAERRAQIAKYDAIKKILSKLKKKTKLLEEQLDQEWDEAVQEHLKQEISVITAQRKKGLTILKEIKEARKK
ncbi:MAG: hypothetical protein L3J28_09080 [Candidatus Polarisedimenticolaceae bacterium]|nr:hypothetical protein [Candidatus Polarisedimenticolaceae bacterium]